MMDIGIAIFLAGVWIAEGIANTRESNQSNFAISLCTTFAVVVIGIFTEGWF